MPNKKKLSLMTGDMPGLFLFSKGDKTLSSNYSPISMLSTGSKVVDIPCFFSFLSENSLISDHQWGFMLRRSSISALCLITHNWLGVLEDKMRFVQSSLT